MRRIIRTEQQPPKQKQPKAPEPVKEAPKKSNKTPCPKCGSRNTRKHGSNRSGDPKIRCNDCGKGSTLSGKRSHGPQKWTTCRGCGGKAIARKQLGRDAQICQNPGCPHHGKKLSREINPLIIKSAADDFREAHLTIERAKKTDGPISAKDHRKIMRLLTLSHSRAKRYFGIGVLVDWSKCVVVSSQALDDRKSSAQSVKIYQKCRKIEAAFSPPKGST